MTDIAEVVDAVNVILRRLDGLPTVPEVAELRDRAHTYIDDVVDGNTARPFSEVRDAMLLKVLALHIAANKVAASLALDGERRAGLATQPGAAIVGLSPR